MTCNSTCQNGIFTYTKSKMCNFLILLPFAVSLDVDEWNPHGARGRWKYLRCLLMLQLLFLPVCVWWLSPHFLCEVEAPEEYGGKGKPFTDS